MQLQPTGVLPKWGRKEKNPGSGFSSQLQQGGFCTNSIHGKVNNRGLSSNRRPGWRSAIFPTSAIPAVGCNATRLQ
jgi:hypothetical protein